MNRYRRLPEPRSPLVRVIQLLGGGERVVGAAAIAAAVDSLR